MFGIAIFDSLCPCVVGLCLSKHNVIRCRDLQGKHSVSTIFALMIAGTSWICQATGINPTLDTCYVFLIRLS